MAIRPPPLRPGDAIGIVTPSSPGPTRYPERLRQGSEFLTSLGFRPVCGAMAHLNEGYRSGTGLDRAKELNAFVVDANVAGIMSSVGGWNSSSLLPFIDYDAIRKQPKVIIGYSDFCAVLLAVYRKTGLITFHGPALIPSFGEWPAPFDETVTSFWNAVVLGEFDLVPPRFWTDEFSDWSDVALRTVARIRHPNLGWTTLRPGSCEGVLIGGNLETFCTLLGTEYCPDFTDAILFFEECDCDISQYERNLNQLRLHGVLDRISGIIIGKHERLRGESIAANRGSVLEEFLPTRAVPVLVDVDLGHTAPMLTLPIGARAALNATERTIRLLEPVLQR